MGTKKAIAVKRVSKPNSVFPMIGTAIIHLVPTLPSGSSSLPENAVPINRNARTGRPHSTFPYLALHREEFTWPMPVTRHAGELLPHPFTHIPITRDWSALCCTCRHPEISRCPAVSRPAALWCSDFPPRRIGAIAQRASLARLAESIAKNVEQSNISVTT